MVVLQSQQHGLAKRAKKGLIAAQVSKDGTRSAIQNMQAATRLCKRELGTKKKEGGRCKAHTQKG